MLLVVLGCALDGPGRVHEEAAVVSESDLSAGAVLLLKTRRRPELPPGPVGTRRTGLPDLDAFLRLRGAHAIRAFPFDLRGTHDRVGLRRWLVVDVPGPVEPGVLLAELRSCPDLYPESLLLEDAAWLRVASADGWPDPLGIPEPERVAWGSETRPPPGLPSERAEVASLLPLADAWPRSVGSGVGIAVVDTGVDRNHAALAGAIRLKAEEGVGGDGDGNGIPGDASGFSIGHLAIAHDGGPPYLASGLADDVSDWGRPSTARGHGTALAALAAGRWETGALAGAVAPGAWILPVDVQENATATEGNRAIRDPRARAAREVTASTPFRSPPWLRAAGLVYAVTEGVRVVLCAWPDVPAHWILHDALRFAEDNCVLPVCAIDPPARSGVPTIAGWRLDWLRAHGGGSGSILDGSTGGSVPDFPDLPLRATLVVGAAGRPATSRDMLPDLLAPGGPVRSAVSSPGNDRDPRVDRGVARYSGSGVAAAFVAGAAALVSAHRPDLEPHAVRSALLRGGAPHGGGIALDPDGALRAADDAERGSCEEIDARRARALSRDDRRTRFWLRVDSPLSRGRSEDPPRPPGGRP